MSRLLVKYQVLNDCCSILLLIHRLTIFYRITKMVEILTCVRSKYLLPGRIVRLLKRSFLERDFHGIQASKQPCMQPLDETMACVLFLLRRHCSVRSKWSWCWATSLSQSCGRRLNSPKRTIRYPVAWFVKKLQLQEFAIIAWVSPIFCGKQTWVYYERAICFCCEAFCARWTPYGGSTTRKRKSRNQSSVVLK